MPMIKLSKDHYDANVKKVGKIVDDIMNMHEKQKGIIHSVTYNLQTHIFNGVSPTNKKRLLCRDMDILNGEKYGVKIKNSRLLELHEENSSGSVLLSPSMMEGVDLYDDLSEFQIIIKLPWANLGDARINLKSKLDSDWYKNKMWLGVLQASGRSTRHDKDSSITYIIDSNFPFFYQEWKNALPDWFKTRLVF